MLDDLWRVSFHDRFPPSSFLFASVLQMTAQGMTDSRIMDALTPVSKAQFAKRIALDRMATMSANKKPRTIDLSGNCEASRLTDNMCDHEDEVQVVMGTPSEESPLLLREPVMEKTRQTTTSSF